MAQKKAMKKNAGGRPKAIAVLGLIALLAAAFVIFWNKYTLIRVIEVHGASERDAAEIVEHSGITTDMRLSDLNAEKLEHTLGTLGKWEYLGYEETGTNSLRLNVRTRTERAVVHYAGSSIVLDEYAQVMQNERQDPQYSLLEVKGLQITSVIVGRELVTADKNQVITLSNLICALDRCGVYSRIRELNVANLDNLFMITVNGMRVDIGDESELDTKFAWLVGVLDSLEAEGKYTGTIDVSTAKSAVYKPQ